MKRSNSSISNTHVPYGRGFGREEYRQKQPMIHDTGDSTKAASARRFRPSNLIFFSVISLQVLSFDKILADDRLVLVKAVEGHTLESFCDCVVFNAAGVQFETVRFRNSPNYLQIEKVVAEGRHKVGPSGMLDAASRTGQANVNSNVLIESW